MTTRLTVRRENGQVVLAPEGEWTVRGVGVHDSVLRRLRDEVDPGAVSIDLRRLGRIDTAGALALGRVLDRCSQPDADFHFIGEHPSARDLMNLVRAHTQSCPPPPMRGPGLLDMFSRAGEGLIRALGDFIAILSFFGRLLAAIGRVVIHPKRLRLTPTVAVIESAGLNAMPIVATLNFFVGAVVAYLGANLLQQQIGATIYAVELVGYAILREFGVVITAILIAGRSDSAFTAKIGAMGMQQEIDALRALGLDPMETLVVPRVLACVVVVPLLSFTAMVTGLLGGMTVLAVSGGVSPEQFFQRLASQLDTSHFFAGIAKAPVFALVIALIGCWHGLQVRGGVDSLGRHVTASVVQSIFAVIVIDAVFAMIYLELGV